MWRTRFHLYLLLQKQRSLISRVTLIIHNITQNKKVFFYKKIQWTPLLVQNCRQKSNSVQSFPWPFLLTAKQAKSLVIILLNSSRSITNQCQIFILVANRRGQWCWLIKISSSASKKCASNHYIFSSAGNSSVFQTEYLHLNTYSNLINQFSLISIVLTIS